MEIEEKQELLSKARAWFREVIVPNHKSNIGKASELKAYDFNPFLISYLAGVIGGELSPKTVSKALLYPRVLGTSITTSFGQNIQGFLTTLFEAYGSIAAGIDIEFIDAIDGRKKYCQLKLGPNTINKDDVTTIHNHFSAIRRLASANFNQNIGFQDLVVGVLYGEEASLSAHYKKLQEEHNYALYVGQEFWYRFAGDEDFYFDLQSSMAQVARESDLNRDLQEAVKVLANDDGVKKLARSDY